MPTVLRCVLIALTCTGWATAIADALPWTGRFVSPELGLLAVAVGSVGSIAFAVRHWSRPAEELFLMGRQVGRHEAEQEALSDQVVRFGKDSPHLTVVDDGS
jgi:hypothetical protein